MNDIKIIKDNTAQVQKELQEKLIKALETVGLVAEGDVKKKTPVGETGRLRNSITHVTEESEKAVYIGTNTEYAPYVELGTSKMKAKPYLKPTVEANSEKYKKIIEQTMSED